MTNNVAEYLYDNEFIDELEVISGTGECIVTELYTYLAKQFKRTTGDTGGIKTIVQSILLKRNALIHDNLYRIPIIAHNIDYIVNRKSNEIKLEKAEKAVVEYLEAYTEI